jgi:leukotriene-A4 hydrolase
VGRMKYLKPLYTALMKNDQTAAFAKEVFNEVSDSYHPLSKGSVAGILKG